MVSADDRTIFPIPAFRPRILRELVFAGRTLEFVRAEEMTAYLRRADGKKAFMIAWAGAKMPLSSELAVPSPFALPLMVDRFREKLSTEKLKDRLERMLKEMAREADSADEAVARR